MILRAIVYLFLSLVLIACSSPGQQVQAGNISLVRLQKLADQSLPVARKKVSRNGREFYSVPFITEKGEFLKAKGSKYRKTAVIKVLGDRRPYSIEVEVIKEERNSDGMFIKTGYDEGLARVITRRIQKALVQRREDRNIIDDFKAF